MPYIQKKTELNNNNINNMQNPGIKSECKDEEKNKKIPAILVPASLFYNPIVKASLFYNPIVKNHKNIYGKYPKKKLKPFVERQGDWICKYCKNLNFAFRNECNRCGLQKKDCLETVKHNEENEINNKLKIQNKKTNKYKKNYSNQINDKNYNQNQNLKHLDYNMNDKSVEE